MKGVKERKWVLLQSLKAISLHSIQVDKAWHDLASDQFTSLIY